jgi:HAD superfamily hydrolase (TIGR01662 family)
MIKCILFDFGNTLVRHDNLDWKKLERAGLFNQINFLEKRSIKGITLKGWSDLFYKFYGEQEKHAKNINIEISIYRIFRSLIEIYKLPPDITPEVLTQIFYQPICQSRILFDDVPDSLKKLSCHKVPMGIVSNSVIPGTMVREVLTQLRIIEYFDLILISSDLGYRKPHPAMFEIALKRLQIKPAQIIFIGDQLDVDVTGAQKAGIVSVWLNRTKEKNKSLVKPGLVVSSLTELPVSVLLTGKKIK